MCERLAQVRCPAVWWPAAVRFLTRTFRNVLYVRVGKLIVCFVAFAALANGRLRRLEASGETEVGRRRSHAHCRCWRRGHAPPVRKPKPNLNHAATSAGVTFPETGQFLLLCSLQLWQQLQRCRQTRARVPLFFFIHFTSVLRKQFAANDTFLREANSTSERSR